MNRQEIIDFLGNDWFRVTGYMDDALGSDVALLRSINERVRSHSGKMLRPMVAMLMAKACGEPNEDTFRYAAAVELLHNATLMHDDVADGSSERRGLPTVAAMLGPSAAVLVGDFWLSKAVDLVLDSSSYQSAAGLFAKSLTHLAEGEMIQLEKAVSGDTIEEDYLRIIECKTASLFLTSVQAAVQSLGAPDEYKDAAREYGLSLGMAFQIKDDILDYVGTDELGKPTGVDLKEKKITLPLLGALRNSGREAEIRCKIKEIDSHPGNCGEIRRFVIENGGLTYASSRLEDYIGRAKRALDPIPDSRAKDFLVQIAEYNALRNI